MRQSANLSAADTLKAVMRALAGHQNGRLLADDVTLVTARLV